MQTLVYSLTSTGKLSTSFRIFIDILVGQEVLRTCTLHTSHHHHTTSYYPCRSIQYCNIVMSIVATGRVLSKRLLQRQVPAALALKSRSHHPDPFNPKVTKGWKAALKVSQSGCNALRCNFGSHHSLKLLRPPLPISGSRHPYYQIRSRDFGRPQARSPWSFVDCR
jgi:hypothetical protein